MLFILELISICFNCLLNAVFSWDFSPFIFILHVCGFTYFFTSSGKGVSSLIVIFCLCWLLRRISVLSLTHYWYRGPSRSSGSHLHILPPPYPNSRRFREIWLAPIFMPLEDIERFKEVSLLYCGLLDSAVCPGVGGMKFA